MVSTPNYQLLQPDDDDFVDVVTQLNDNWTRIDQDMNRFDVQIFTGAGTWTKPARCKRVICEVIGGGGAGGGSGATAGGQAACGGGGGGGGYSRKLFLASSLASTEAIDVGAGGTGAASGNNPGGNGGISRFATGKAYVVQANGGVGGSGMAATAQNSVNGGAGGVASGGDFNISGDDGGIGLVAGGIAYFFAMGGRSHYSGIVWPPAATASTGKAGYLYGGGSSGSVEGASGGGRASLAGAAGLVIVTNYY